MTETTPPPATDVQQLIHSFVRLSTAMTVYGMQQVQTAVESRDPQGSLHKLNDLVESLTGALSSQLDEARKATLANVSGVGADVVSKTLGALNPATLNPQEIMQATGDIIKRTSASLSSLMNPKPSAGEPQAAGEVLHA